MPKLDDQISTLQERLGQLKLRQQRIDARKRAVASDRERKTETRRRILVGTVVMDKLRRGELDRDHVLAWLDQSLGRTADRDLFGLPPRAEAGAQAPLAVLSTATADSVSESALANSPHGHPDSDV